MKQNIRQQAAFSKTAGAPSPTPFLLTDASFSLGFLQNGMQWFARINSFPLALFSLWLFNDSMKFDLFIFFYFGMYSLY